MTLKQNRLLADALRTLAGQPLSSVTFVEDYLQIAFAGARITMIVHPKIFLGDRAIAWDALEFCATLRAQIGVELKSTEVTATEVTLVLANGTRLVTVFDEEPSLVERFMLTTDSGGTWVV